MQLGLEQEMQVKLEVMAMLGRASRTDVAVAHNRWKSQPKSIMQTNSSKYPVHRKDGSLGLYRHRHSRLVHSIGMQTMSAAAGTTALVHED